MTGRPGSLRGLARVLLVLALAVQVAGLYSPPVPGPDGVPGLDKVVHVLLFAAPAALAWGLGARWVVVFLLVHAVVAEPLQHLFAPGREAEIGDAVANLLGVALGALAARAVRPTGHDGGPPSDVDREGRR